MFLKVESVPPAATLRRPAHPPVACVACPLHMPTCSLPQAAFSRSDARGCVHDRSDPNPLWLLRSHSPPSKNSQFSNAWKSRSEKFQWLEKGSKKVPIIGKTQKKSSNHWKKSDLFFQPLEDSYAKSSNHWKNIKKKFQSLEEFRTWRLRLRGSFLR